MKQRTTNNRQYIPLLILLTTLVSFSRVQAQCSWQLTATADPATCTRNGKVTAILTNTGYSNIEYSLQSLTGTFSIPPSGTAIFTGLAPDRYRVTVTGTCDQQAGSISYDVTVTGNYSPPGAVTTQERPMMQGCRNGQLKVVITNGNPPFIIRLAGRPSGYSGKTAFQSTTQDYIIDSLPAGPYVITVTDACSAATPPQAVKLDSTALDGQVGVRSDLNNLGDNCNALINRPPRWFGDASYSDLLVYSYSINGGDRVPYKSINAPGFDTLLLPAGQTMRDLYGKFITYYINAGCGPELLERIEIFAPSLNLVKIFNCEAEAYDVQIGIGDRTFACFPVTFALKNNATGGIQTFVATSTGWSLQLPYGSYSVTATDVSGYIIGQNTDWDLPSPDLTNPYQISASEESGLFGNDSACYFVVDRPGGVFPDGTTVELVSSDGGYTYSDRTYNGSWLKGAISAPDHGGPIFTPGHYNFHVTDGCTGIVYELPITVDTSDVFIYTWNVAEEQTCTGKILTPTGFARYQHNTYPAVFQILAGPAGGYNDSIVHSGTPLELRAQGNYSIYTSAIGVAVFEYTYNRKNFSYFFEQLNVNKDSTIGWVCPNMPADSGNIFITAKYGQKGTSSRYQYKLANLGESQHGNFLDSNYTGRFSTSSSGGRYVLTRDKDYEVQISDECNGFYTDTVHIIDLTTAQLAFVDQSEYCIGDAVSFSVINLPATANEYLWSGPDGFQAVGQYPVLNEVKTSSAGKYAVTISTDICLHPIYDTVEVKLAPYTVSCFSAITDWYVNPYVYGLLGSWHPSATYTYYARRAESDPATQTNIRKDGAFSEFIAFWQKQTDSAWGKQAEDTNWVWNAKTTLFNKKGFELENKDPLGRYNAGIYGYNNSLPIAVIQNSRYCESFFDGFEDYGYDVSGCPDGSCPPERRLNINGVVARITTSEKHTGRYSLRVGKGDTIGVKLPVTATVQEPGTLGFNTGEGTCAPDGQVLYGVYADKNVLLPPISLLSGKKMLFSAWVKESVDCKCTSYDSSDIRFLVKGEGSIVNITAHPTGAIIDGWQRYEQVVDLPQGTDSLSIVMEMNGADTAYFDDIRLHPYNANMKSFIYDAQNLRLMAELDENNYATFYEYDDDGSLTRLKKETERGVKTIQETRSALIKETMPDEQDIDK